MSYTKEQEQIALEVLSKDRHAFYDILKVSKSADDGEIKKSYRKLAVKLHPDKNPHPKASEAFKVINRAFEVLSDESKRSMYDRIGRDPDDRQMPGAGGGFSSSSMDAGFPMDFQEAFFGRRGGAGMRDPREDLFEFLFNVNNQSPFGHPFGSPFMNGGTTSFTFGGPGGFKVYTNPSGSRFQQRQRQQQQQQQDQEPLTFYERFVTVLPLLLLLLVPLIERFLFG